MVGETGVVGVVIETQGVDVIGYVLIGGEVGGFMDPHLDLVQEMVEKWYLSTVQTDRGGL